MRERPARSTEPAAPRAYAGLRASLCKVLLVAASVIPAHTSLVIPAHASLVIPAYAGIQKITMDSGVRRNDDEELLRRNDDEGRVRRNDDEGRLRRNGGSDVLQFETAEFVASDAKTPPESGWKPQRLPDSWLHNHPGFKGIGWYRMRFRLDALPPAGAALYVSRVSFTGQLWLNG